MNEPQLGYDFLSQRRWQGMIKDLYQAVRAESPDMVVVVSGGRGGGLDGLLNLDPAPFAGDPQVRYSLHYYLPYIFSHQGVVSPYPTAHHGIHHRSAISGQARRYGAILDAGQNPHRSEQPDP